MRADKFSDIICCLDDMTDSQCRQLLLRMRELETNENTAICEVMSSFNSLNEDSCIAVLKRIKAQFDPEDWETITEII